MGVNQVWGGKGGPAECFSRVPFDQMQISAHFLLTSLASERKLEGLLDRISLWSGNVVYGGSFLIASNNSPNGHCWVKIQLLNELIYTPGIFTVWESLKRYYGFYCCAILQWFSFSLKTLAVNKAVGRVKTIFWYRYSDHYRRVSEHQMPNFASFTLRHLWFK